MCPTIPGSGGVVEQLGEEVWEGLGLVNFAFARIALHFASMRYTGSVLGLYGSLVCGHITGLYRPAGAMDRGQCVPA